MSGDEEDGAGIGWSDRGSRLLLVLTRSRGGLRQIKGSAETCLEFSHLLWQKMANPLDDTRLRDRGQGLALDGRVGEESGGSGRGGPSPNEELGRFILRAGNVACDLSDDNRRESCVVPVGLHDDGRSPLCLGGILGEGKGNQNDVTPSIRDRTPPSREGPNPDQRPPGQSSRRDRAFASSRKQGSPPLPQAATGVSSRSSRADGGSA